MNEQQLLDLKQKIDEAKQKASEYKGQLNHLMKQLEQDWECENLKVAKKLLADLKKEVEQLNNSLNEGILEFEEKYYTESE